MNAQTMKASTQHKKRSLSFGRILFYIVLFLIVSIIIGFFSFIDKVTHPQIPSPVPIADGIVVWTGKGGGRLEAGAKLLEADHGERLLISGVNKDNSREDIIKLLNLSTEKANCCIDLDYAAIDTAGNARETANWTQVMGYEHIILVTSSYHMPRAEIEIATARGRIRITPYPVMSEQAKPWWKSSSYTKRLIREYGKLLLTYIRRPSSHDDRGAPVLEDFPNTAPELSPDEPQKTD